MESTVRKLSWFDNVDISFYCKVETDSPPHQDRSLSGTLGARRWESGYTRQPNEWASVRRRRVS